MRLLGGYLGRAALAAAVAIFPIFPAASASATATAGASSLRVLDTAAEENRTNGKIFAVDPVFGPYTCSGTALDTPSRSIVLTAGHCVTREGRRGREFAFVPAYDHGARPFGTFAASAVYTMLQWRRFENPDFDVAAIRVKPGQIGALGDIVGGRQWTIGRSRFAPLQIFGYPAGALAGESLRSCETQGLGSDALINSFPGPPPVPARCDMAGGSSGGAWLLGGQVAGVTSYGYGRNRGRLYSPYFGSAVGAFLSGLP
jgi:V8-like Glu-specific endopeptidase